MGKTILVEKFIIAKTTKRTLGVGDTATFVDAVTYWNGTAWSATRFDGKRHETYSAAAVVIDDEIVGEPNSVYQVEKIFVK
jgi:hypothetical protein